MTTLQTAGAAMDSADALKELIAKQAVEIEQLRKDAERYRWLSDGFVWDNEGGRGFWTARFACDQYWNDIDAAIDAAIQKETP